MIEIKSMWSNEMSSFNRKNENLLSTDCRWIIVESKKKCLFLISFSFHRREEKKRKEKKHSMRIKQTTQTLKFIIFSLLFFQLTWKSINVVIGRAKIFYFNHLHRSEVRTIQFFPPIVAGYKAKYICFLFQIVVNRSVFLLHCLLQSVQRRGDVRNEISSKRFHHFDWFRLINENLFNDEI